jgi:iduronate 2-sulfatase
MFLKILFIFASFLNIACGDGNLRKPNVLFMMLDDFRGGINVLGDKLAKTPNMDLLAEKSFYFPNIYAQQALCAPSRNSMLTSRRPDTLLTYNFNNYWRTFAGNYTTLPQYFKEHGYHAESIGKIFHHGPSSNKTDDYPYSWSNPTFIPSSQEYRNKPVCKSDDGELRRNLLCSVVVDFQPEGTLPDIESAIRAREFLSTTPNDKPFFLGVGFYKPHIPFKFPVEYLERHDIDDFRKDHLRPIDIPLVAWNPYNDLRERDDVKSLNISYPFGPIPSEFAARIRQHYYASVSYVDDLIGEILEVVNFTNTIIVLTSDHGWSLGEHSEWSKYSNYEVSLKVPLIIYDPRAPQMKVKRIESIGELIDVFPTLADVAKLPPMPECENSNDYEEEKITCAEGKSLYSKMLNMNDEDDDGNVAFSQYPRPTQTPSRSPDSDQPKLREIKIMGYTIRTNRFRYTAWIKFNSKKFKRSKRNEIKLIFIFILLLSLLFNSF